MAQRKIIVGYARMWPREVFEKVQPQNGGRKIIMAKSSEFLSGPGVYILYRDDEPYYIGQAEKLRRRLWNHAIKTDSRYYHFWNFFSAFAINDENYRNEVEGILIAALPTAANSAKPKLPKEKMPRDVGILLRKIYAGRISLL
ncbi:MAG TPA: GIY-YIG nuclease family protein [Terriglobales bacterium]|nr:GIY-YIG nuclease family protein [Terriglobales bacterium]